MVKALCLTRRKPDAETLFGVTQTKMKAIMQEPELAWEGETRIQLVVQMVR